MSSDKNAGVQDSGEGKRKKPQKGSLFGGELPSRNLYLVTLTTPIGIKIVFGAIFVGD